MPIMKDEYPHWICRDCAKGLSHPAKTTVSSFHQGHCGWCLKITSVTQPRDFGYPPFKGVVPEKVVLFNRPPQSS